MSKIRTIRRILKGRMLIDGAGMKQSRTFANNDVEDFDPFLLDILIPLILRIRQGP